MCRIKDDSHTVCAWLLCWLIRERTQRIWGSADSCPDVTLVLGLGLWTIFPPFRSSVPSIQICGQIEQRPEKRNNYQTKVWTSSGKGIWICMFSVFVYFFVLFCDRASLYSQDWHQTWDPPTSASWGLELYSILYTTTEYGASILKSYIMLTNIYWGKMLTCKKHRYATFI
jgi:hypothetical protein